MKNLKDQISDIVLKRYQGEEAWIPTIENLEKLFKQWALEMVGEDEDCLELECLVEHDHHGNDIRQEIRKRIEES